MTKLKTINQKCKYCNINLILANSGGIYVCKCEKAIRDWEINMEIQGVEHQIIILNKKKGELNDLLKELLK